jgi:hypothetical protein
MKSTIVVTVVLCTLAGQALADDMSAEQVATAKWMIEQIARLGRSRLVAANG